CLFTHPRNGPAKPLLKPNGRGPAEQFECPATVHADAVDFAFWRSHAGRVLHEFVFDTHHARDQVHEFAHGNDALRPEMNHFAQGGIALGGADESVHDVVHVGEGAGGGEVAELEPGSLEQLLDDGGHDEVTAHAGTEGVEEPHGGDGEIVGEVV